MSFHNVDDAPRPLTPYTPVPPVNGTMHVRRKWPETIGLLSCNAVSSASASAGSAAVTWPDGSAPSHGARVPRRCDRGYQYSQ